MHIQKLKNDPAQFSKLLLMANRQGLTFVNCAKQGGTLSPSELRLAILDTISAWTGLIGLKPEDGSLLTSLDWSNFRAWFKNKPDDPTKTGAWQAQCPIEGPWLTGFLALASWLETKHYDGLKTLAQPELVEHVFNPVQTSHLASMGIVLTPTVRDPQLQKLAAWQTAGVLCGIDEAMMQSEEWETGQIYWLTNGKAHSNWMSSVVATADFLVDQFQKTEPQPATVIPTGLVPKGVGLPEGSLKREKAAWSKRMWMALGSRLGRELRGGLIGVGVYVLATQTLTQPLSIAIAAIVCVLAFSTVVDLWFKAQASRIRSVAVKKQAHKKTKTSEPEGGFDVENL